MKATISQAALNGCCQNAINHSSKKEMVAAYSGVSAEIWPRDSAATIEEPVIVRFYMRRSTTSSVVYCSLWIHKTGLHTSGHGKSDGYGDDKFTAAFKAAAESAGITFTDYNGEVEIEDSIMAIMEAMGYWYNYTKLVVNHR